MTNRNSSKFGATLVYFGVQNVNGFENISLSPKKRSYEKFWT